MIRRRGRAPAAAGRRGAKPSGNPSDPRSPSDFVLAARSGYAPGLRGRGAWKLGVDGRSIVRADGSPATPEDYARLRRGILELPAALGRRPDFFAAVSPAHFNDLKDGYRENPDLAGSVYKDVGTTAADRDFVNTASCAKISGSCNENIDKTSYKKGDYVAPEDPRPGCGDCAAEGASTTRRIPTARLRSRRGALAPATPAVAADAPAMADGRAPGPAGRRRRQDGRRDRRGSRDAGPAPPPRKRSRRLWRATAAALGLGGEAADGAARARPRAGRAGAFTPRSRLLAFALRKRV